MRGYNEKKKNKKKHFVYCLLQILDLFLQSLMNEKKLHEQILSKSSSVNDIIHVVSEIESLLVESF